MKELMHDRIMEAYNGKMGDALMRATRERIHWIAKQCHGVNILDVGCSQGTLSILLAREGKKIIGIDIDSLSIQEANNYLKEEEAVVQSNVYFMHNEFTLENFGNQKFDTIIMAEVLEHLTRPEDFIEHANNLLTDDGTLIITVPFGINDFIDHKQTFYFYDLFTIITKKLCIDNYKIFGKWIGFVCKKDNNQECQISGKILQDVEASFFDIERSLIDEKERIISNLNDANLKYRNVTQQYQNREEILNKLKKEQEEAQKALEEKESAVEALQAEVDLLSSQQSDLKTQLEKEQEEAQKALEEKESAVEALQNKLKEVNIKCRQQVNKEVPFHKQENKKIQFKLKQQETNYKIKMEQLNHKVRIAEQKIIQTRNTLSFQVGYQMVHAFKPWYNIFTLPIRIGKIVHKLSKNKKKIEPKHEISKLKLNMDVQTNTFKMNF